MKNQSCSSVMAGLDPATAMTVERLLPRLTTGITYSGFVTRRAVANRRTKANFEERGKLGGIGPLDGIEVCDVEMKFFQLTLTGYAGGVPS
jgi:hypothetical protein